MNDRIKSSTKYAGIYHRVLSNDDLTYYISYKDSNNNKKWVKVGKKSEGINIAFCHQQRNEIINKAKFGDTAPLIKHRQKNGLTFNDLIDQYLQSKELSPKVALSYKTIKNVFTDMFVSDITIDEINKLKATLADDGKAPKTINCYLQQINALFNYAIDRELFKGANPCRKIDKPKVDNNRERFLSADEIIRLKEAIKHKEDFMLFVELSLSTGGRLNTITAIKKKDINLERRTINLYNIKSKNNYTGFISSALLPLLTQRYKALHAPNDTILTSSHRTIQKQLQPRLNKLFNQGLDSKDRKNRVVIHTLRHTFASHLAIKGVPIFTIMKLLDHKNIKDTLRYAKLAPDNGLEAVKELW
ncbi:MAG: site-specific integrase [Campylobacteraceae bacterium]|jgi:integrase|nr:site-specific integrase [Campylobacteraceae bacterium]